MFSCGSGLSLLVLASRAYEGLRLTPMEPWYKVALPRIEVREGRLPIPNEFAIALSRSSLAAAPPKAFVWASSSESRPRYT